MLPSSWYCWCGALLQLQCLAAFTRANSCFPRWTFVRASCARSSRAIILTTLCCWSHLQDDLSPRWCDVRFITELLYIWIKANNVWVRALMLLHCCIYLISLPATIAFYFATSMRFRSVLFWCKLQRICILPGIGMGPNSNVTCKWSELMCTTAHPSVEQLSNSVSESCALTSSCHQNNVLRQFLRQTALRSYFADHVCLQWISCLTLIINWNNPSLESLFFLA